MNIQDVIKKLVSENNIVKAEKYDLFYRDYDNMVELIGWLPDPNYDMKDFQGREMLFPKRWLTLGVFDAEMKVAV